MILNRDMRTLPGLLQKHRATQIYSTPAAYHSLLEVASMSISARFASVCRREKT